MVSLGVTVVGAILYAVIASSCGVDADGNDAAPPTAVDATGTPLIAPTVVSALPADGAVVRSEMVVRVTFSQAMAEGAEQALIISAAGQPVRGERAWDTTRTVLAFRPESDLAIGDYELVVDIDAAAANGQPMPSPEPSGYFGMMWKWMWNTAWCAAGPLFCRTL